MTEKEAFEYFKRSAKELGLNEEESILQAKIWLNDAYPTFGDKLSGLVILGLSIGVFIICVLNLL